MKYLYKYPQNAFPYVDLINTNRGRSRKDPEYELLDTEVFNGERYFDGFVEYAKAAPTDLLIQISVHNRGSGESVAHVLPTLWFRNTWSWWPDAPKPSLRAQPPRGSAAVIAATDTQLGDYSLYCEDNPVLLFTENETNNQRLFGTDNPTPYVKDGINDCVVADRQSAVNPSNIGTKAALGVCSTARTRSLRWISWRSSAPGDRPCCGVMPEPPHSFADLSLVAGARKCQPSCRSAPFRVVAARVPKLHSQQAVTLRKTWFECIAAQSPTRLSEPQFGQSQQARMPAERRDVGSRAFSDPTDGRPPKTLGRCTSIYFCFRCSGRADEIRC